MIIEGKAAWIFPDNFDVDDIIGAANIGLQSNEEIKRVLMKDLDPEFVENSRPKDLLIAGKNCGYGHAHPQPMQGMRAIGIDTIVAESFTFPFYRSELASGMKMLICEDITSHVEKGDHVKIDTQTLEVEVNGKLVTKLKEIAAYPMSLMENSGSANIL